MFEVRGAKQGSGSTWPVSKLPLPFSKRFFPKGHKEDDELALKKACGIYDGSLGGQGQGRGKQKGSLCYEFTPPSNQSCKSLPVVELGQDCGFTHLFVVCICLQLLSLPQCFSPIAGFPSFFLFVCLNQRLLRRGC